MPLPKYVVRLTAEERAQLEDLIRTGKRAASVIIHARILLKADASAGGPGWDDTRIAEAVECGASTVYRVRQAFVEEGLPAALFRKQPTGRKSRKLDGAKASAPDCSGLWYSPCGAQTLDLAPVGRPVGGTAERGVDQPRMRADDAQQNELKPGLRNQWGIPPPANAEFVCAMEAMLEVYTRPYDPAWPVVCLDEISTQPVAETRPPLPAEPGQPARMDYEYDRGGTANLFLTCEPLAGHRHGRGTERRTAVDFADEVRAPLEVRYAHAERVILVGDNLNTHQPAAL